mmetsp:Transcript_20354/g.54800  ORF Transcript_20354/g.54800 Transcript_20354/m.54800 type:complete len:525 (+) Transcript_20354:145-1719(+)
MQVVLLQLLVALRPPIARVPRAVGAASGARFSLADASPFAHTAHVPHRTWEGTRHRSLAMCDSGGAEGGHSTDPFASEPSEEAVPLNGAQATTATMATALDLDATTPSPPTAEVRMADVVRARMPPSQVLEITRTGAQRRMRTDYATILQQLQLSVRDLRMLRSNAAEVIVHPSRVVFDLGELKGCIYNDRLVLLESQREGAQALARQVLSHIHPENGAKHPANVQQAFGLSVFESVLEECTASFEQSFLRLRGAISRVLPTLTEPGAREDSRMCALSRMLPLENSLSSLRLRVRRVNAILEQLLDSEDDIEGLCGVSSGRKECSPPEYALTEIAIEAFSSRLEALLDQIDSLTEGISTARNSLEIALDAERNRIARLELYTSLFSLPLAGVGAVAGIFGMNLTSGLEEAAHLFWGVTVGTVTVAFAAFTVCLRRYHRSAVTQGRQVLDAQAMKRALDLMEQVHYIARRRGAFVTQHGSDSGVWPIKDLKELLRENNIHVSSQRELEFLQAMFDDRQPRSAFLA